VTRQLPLDLPHRPALGMEDFLVAGCNRAAVALVDRWPDWPAPLAVITGPEGSGKTHLAHVWQAKSGAKPVPGLAGLDPGALAPGFALVVEDVAAPLGAESERALFHLYNLAGEAGGHVLLTAREPPARWTVALPDLASRLTAAPTAAIGAPDDALLAAVLVKLFADRQIKIGTDVVTYLLARMERSFAAARTLAAALDRAALASGRKVSVALARTVLDDETAGGRR